MRGHLRLLAQPLVEPLQQRAAAREHDPAIHDVRRQLGRRAVQRLLDRVDDLHERLLERGADLLGGQHDGLGQAGDQVAAPDLRLHLLLQRVGGADLELDLLGRLLADQELVLLLDVVDDRLVELVAADADRLARRRCRRARSRPPRRCRRRCRRPCCRSARRPAGRRRSRPPSAPRSGTPGARRRDRHASSTARFSTPVTPEGTQTTTRGCAQRFWCTFWMKWRSISSVTSKSAITPSFSGRMAEIVPGVRPSMRLASMPDRVDLAVARVDRHDGRLGEHDPAPPHVDEGVGGAEVDGHVTAAETGEVREEAHGRARGRPRGTVRGPRRALSLSKRPAPKPLQAARQEAPSSASTSSSQASCASRIRRARRRLRRRAALAVRKRRARRASARSSQASRRGDLRAQRRAGPRAPSRVGELGAEQAHDRPRSGCAGTRAGVASHSRSASRPASVSR